MTARLALRNWFRNRLARQASLQRRSTERTMPAAA
jgi:hypothetical protein